MPRPKGSKNEKTLQWDAFGKTLMDEGLPRLLRIMRESDDETFLKHYILLLEFFKPKLKRIEQTSSADKHVIEVRWEEPGPIEPLRKAV